MALLSDVDGKSKKKKMKKKKNDIFAPIVDWVVVVVVDLLSFRMFSPCMGLCI
jgi:Mn2+/Fe2+ NRAMP family transporter